ncbi:MAG TPA: DUF3857 domain-containing protein [Clostridia bacterium]|nr:DUF3857 domain-containing protein [Clostridia bacterium]
MLKGVATQMLCHPQPRRSFVASTLALVLLLLSGLTTLGQNASRTPYDKELETIQKQFASDAGVATKAVLLARGYELRELVSDRTALERWLQSVATGNEEALVRDEAQRLALLAARQRGERRDVEKRSPSILLVAKKAVEEMKSAETLETLGHLEQASGDNEALHHFEAAAHMAPTPERWLSVARVCANQLCRFSALQNASRLAPNNPKVQLATAEYYISREQVEKARNLLAAALRSEPNDFVARKRLADIYGSVGLFKQALAEYERLARDFPVPLWLHRELAIAFERAGQLEHATRLAEAAFAENREGAVERSLLARLYEHRRDATGARKFYERIALMDSSDASALSQMARLRLDEGDAAGAERQLRAGVATHPDNALLRQELAELLVLQRRNREAERELKSAALTNPNAVGLRERIAWLGAVSSVEDTEAAYLADFDQVKSNAQGMSGPHDSVVALDNVIALADVRVDRVQQNGLASARVQQIFKVMNAQGAREFGTRAVQYSPASESLEILRARVHKQDGRMIEAEEGGETSVADTGVSMYYDVRSRVLRFPSLEAGDLIELDYRVSPESETNPYGDYYGGLTLFRGTMSTKLKRYVLLTPAERNFHVVETRMPHSASVTVAGGERIYTWEARDLAALPNEPRSPSATEIAPYISVSTFSNWDELGKWYAELVRPQFTLDAALREVAKRISAENPEELARIHAIHQLVLRNTHYVALEFGIYSYKPYPVSQIYARRFGDCKDKASLMIALMRAVGVDAELAMVRTRRMGEINEQVASIAPFNHAIVYLPKYGLWLDGTAEYSGARELPLEDQGAMALTVSADGRTQMHRIPVTTPEDNYTHRAIRAEIRRDGTMQFSGTVYTRGEDAPGLRREYEVAERQRESIRASLAEVFPTVKVENVEVDGAADLEKDVTVKFSGALDAFSGRSSMALTGTWMRRGYLQTLAPLGERTQDLLLPAPWTTEEELQFALPEGTVRVELPQETRLDSKFGSAVLRYDRRGSQVIVRTLVQFRQIRITPAEYAEFREFCAAVERGFRQEVKVTLR